MRVNDVLWQEVPTLHGAGPNDAVYITRTDDAGQTTVQFGDGVLGARLPTGRITAPRIARGSGWQARCSPSNSAC